MSLSTKRVYFDDYMFVVDENVYEPAEDSFLFAENLEVDVGASVLDMGTGCGILGVLAAKKAREVVAVDINPYAVSCAKENAAINNVRGKVSFVQGDLFTWLSEKAAFDVILFNAPYLPAEEGETDSWIGRAWAGGATGRQIIDRFIADVPSHLTQEGRVFLMQSTLSNAEETIKKLAKSHLHARLIAKHALPFFETLTLIEATF